MIKIISLSFFVWLALFAEHSYARDFWVNAAKSTNTQSCTNSVTDPGVNSTSKTIAQGLACVGAASSEHGGDTVHVLAGSYSDSLIDIIPSGTAASSSYFTLKCETSRSCFIRPIASGAHAWGIAANVGSHYVEVRGFVFDGQLSTPYQQAGVSWSGSTVGQHHHIRFIDNEIKGTGTAIQLTGIDQSEITSNYLHDVSDQTCLFGPGNPCPGIYVSNQSANVTIDHNTFGPGLGLCIQIYLDAGSLNHVTVKNNTFNSCQFAAINVYGTNHQIFNNVIWNSGFSVGGQQAQGSILVRGTTGSVAYSNTIYGGGAPAIWNDYNSPQGIDCKNNLAINNAVNGGAIGQIDNCQTSSNNIVTGTAANYFTNAGANNFTLKAPPNGAIDTGANLGTSYNTDVAGAPRGALWDVGAYEYITPAVCPTVSPALVARYDFEGNGTDSTGNGRTASLGSGWTYTTGHTGQGALSNGTSGITVADHDSLDPCAAFTYEGWISLANTSGDYAFINKNPDSKAYLFASIYGYCGSGVPMGGYSDITSPFACSTTTLTPGFKHLAVTYDSTLPSANIKLYLNGAQVASGDGTNLLTATTGTLQFCTSGYGETCPSGTVIDDIRIYNYARSASEILSSITAPPVFTIKLDVSSLKIGPSVSLKVGVP